ncbi:transaldolase [Candidatus Scalindua japonica]|uniref:Transaldolase n=1 Tax=Candidatus Scalindua japonica TaxID=1284222 RepID=A0A286TWH2_9BACT|nr:transaldolase family protein [Candidatus Scalindua japonica]GAX60215.1 transaldolase [Candidatus Scalindua japonica]
MSIFLDTADVEQAKEAKGSGWVQGITTNPILLANSNPSVADTLRLLTEINMGLLFYQLIATSKEEMLEEAQFAKEIAGEQLVLKIPPTKLGFQIIRYLPQEIPCCITAVYSVAQALVARESGVRYIAVYVSRVTKLSGDGLSLITEISSVLQGSRTQLLAASLKSPVEASSAILSGADHITLPFDVLSGLTYHEHSEDAVKDFNANGSGLQM